MKDKKFAPKQSLGKEHNFRKTKAAEKGPKPTSLCDLNNQQELEGFAPLSAAISNQKATAS